MAKEMQEEGRPGGNDGSRDGGNAVETLAPERATESNAIEIPGISLPKGGGALKGIDEKFEVNAANGTAAFSIPLPVSPGRNGFAPQSALSYNSGGGNGPFGLGWSVGVPSIQRKTDKGLPRYRDGGGEEDVFMFSGAEDLTPYLEETAPGNWEPTADTVGEYAVQRYRPRLESGFARIERITHPVHGTYWKVTTSENTVTLFGRDPGARIADPEDGARIFQWLPEFVYDDKGNWMRYEYKAEDLLNVPDEPHEKNRRSGSAPFTNAYLKRVRYGNRTPYFADPLNPYDPPAPADTEHFFEVVFDYGEHDPAVPLPGKTPGLSWDYRPDAFSDYRAGFEIRTYRLCRRVLMFHHFKDEPGFGENVLVRSLDFQYQPSSINGSGQAEVIYLVSVTQTGCIKKPDGGYSRQSLPPMEFEYQQLNWDKTVKTVSRDNIANAPVGLTNNYQWTDLYGDGVPGILSEQASGWFYMQAAPAPSKASPAPPGDGSHGGNRSVRFAAAKEVIPKPSLLGIASGVLSLRDLDADGNKQVVVENPGLQGYFELTEDYDWEPFRAFEATVNIDMKDPNVRLLDLDGDGRPELVMTEENVFVWWPAAGKKGYKGFEKAAKALDEEKGPAVVFADRDQSVFLADMSGDGLTDIARIRNGEICYWPNMGYGRFGTKITMSNAPRFDHPGAFNPKYMHLADVGGSGTTDIVYLGKNTFKAFINLSGSSWSEAHEIAPAFPVDGNGNLSVIDLLGTGTSCIVWSSDLPAHADAPMRYIDLMGSKKPHVMVRYKNNFGKETSIEYKSSVHFYLEDQAAGRSWITKLPFPVQVVSRQIVEDKITGVRFSTQYRYHHGYYDHPEREFRGFGMVEQIDSEDYETWTANAAGTQMEQSRELYQAPVLTKTWFHTGAFLDRERILSQYRHEYWFEEYNRRFPGEPLTVTEPVLEDARVSASPAILDPAAVAELDADQWREALRACKGMVLRREIFALDAPAAGALDDDIKQQLKPYSMETRNCRIQLQQPRAHNPFAVFQVTENETLTLHYERDETDPRTAHTLNVRIDEYGNILETASVVYPRKIEDTKLPQAVKDAQQKTLITYTRNRFTNDVIRPDAYRLRMSCETETFELSDFPGSGALYRVEDFVGVFGAGVQNIPYHTDPEDDPFPGFPKRRLIEHLRSLYYRPDLTGPAALGVLEASAVPFENYQLAYTPALLTHLFGAKITGPDNLMTEAGYVHSEGDVNWWIRSGVAQLIDAGAGETGADARERFFSPIAYTDPFGAVTTVQYDGYYLTIKQTADALQNTSVAEAVDYRTLTPRLLRDINHNLSGVLLDELGQVKAVALMGKDLDNDGVPELETADDLTGLEAAGDAATAVVQAFFQTEDSTALEPMARDLLKHASQRFLYDFHAYRDHGRPVTVAVINRETHHAHLAAGETSKLQFRFQYTDGFGKTAMTKEQAEPGTAKQTTVQADGSYTVTVIDTAALDPPRLRWAGNGRTVFNNKGNPVKQYEPYFSVTPRYEDAAELVESGVTPVMYYDPPGRLIRTDLPDGTFAKVEFDAWKQVDYDQNDTVESSSWWNDRFHRLIDAELTAAGKDPAKEETAAQKAGAHHGTPSVLHLDSLGRPILSVEHNRDGSGNDEFYSTFVSLDIEGNARNIIDARGNSLMTYAYDMLGHRASQNSMDAGERKLLNNAVGDSLRHWDERDHVFSFTYDPLRRPVEKRVAGGEGSTPLNHVYEKISYGENQPDDAANNLRGQPHLLYDTAGKLEFSRYDFKGNVLRSSRRLAADYKQVVNWDGADPDAGLEPETFVSESRYDALDRVIWSQTPDDGVTETGYNEAGLLETVTVTPAGESAAPFVKNIDYDEKGRRRNIVYGNDVKTAYRYDKETFRLLRLETRRADNKLLQDLAYTYDPVGNITEIEDKSIPTVFYDNFQIQPRSRYTYDPLYRLIEAEGKEHVASVGFGPKDNWDDQPFLSKPAPGDPMAWRPYTRTYRYDAVGNIERMRHSAAGGDWTRDYFYETANNRLTHTVVGSDTYACSHHARHGFITGMPHLQVMEWDFKDQLHASARQKVTAGTPETTYYVYGADGQRVRKITENQAAPGETPARKDERIYLDGVEIYRKHTGNHAGLRRTTLHVMDDVRRIALIETRNPVDDGSPAKLVRYQLDNHLGTACLETDDRVNARVISYEEYHPYGTTAYQAAHKDIKAAAKRYRYTGKERDDESGFYYYGARYYAPWLARWTAPDPAGLADGVNPYRFVRGNPITSIDADGKITIPQPIQNAINAVSAAVVGAVRRTYKKYKAKVERFSERLSELMKTQDEVMSVLNVDPKYLSADQRKEVDAVVKRLNDDQTMAGLVFKSLMVSSAKSTPGDMQALVIGGDRYEIGGRLNHRPNFTNPRHISDYAPGVPSPGHPTGHHGVDIFAPRGAPVHAPVTGMVVDIRGVGADKGTDVSGKYIRIRRGDVNYFMGHLDTVEDLKVGDIVTAGQQIGTVGNTGNARRTQPHIHFSVELGLPSKNVTIDPFPHLMEHISPVRKAARWVRDLVEREEAREAAGRAVVQTGKNVWNRLGQAAAASQNPAPQPPQPQPGP